jgi:hypothetical protein
VRTAKRRPERFVWSDRWPAAAGAPCSFDTPAAWKWPLTGADCSMLRFPQQSNPRMQCFVFDGLGDGLGSADDDGSGLEGDPVGVLVTAVGVAPVA